MRSPSTKWSDRLATLDLGFWRLPDQVVRLGALFIVLIAVMVVAWYVFTPSSFGELGHYRAQAVTMAANHEPVHAGWQVCVMCHDTEGEAKNASFHRLVSCETCHGPARKHAQARMEGEEELKPDHPHIPRTRDACLHCHGYLPSRPTGFPQVIQLLHNPSKPCTACHNPHDPKPPEAIGSCSACHGQIARMKAISPHSTLDCEICHETPAEHREVPRLHLPKKPASRDFCGQCHVEGAQPPAGFEVPKDIPHIDNETHGVGYLCWQCHYPHFPEGR